MDEDLVAPEYNDGNRAFLQALMARGTMTYHEARPIIANIMAVQEAGDQDPPRADPNSVSQEDFTAYMAAAQEAVSHFDYEIRNTVHQVSRERVYAIVNTASDPMTQLATLHNPDQIAFVKRVIDAMFEKYNTRRMEVMCVDSMQANKFRHASRADADESMNIDGEGETQASQGVRGIKSSEVGIMLAAMVDEGWFEKSRHGFYSLSPRALLELRSWLVDAYNDPDLGPDDWQRIKFCEACKEIVTVGQRCADRDCNVRIHDICEDAFWRTRRDKSCPKCSTAWDGRHFVGSKAVTETGAYKRGRMTNGRSRGSLMEDIMQDEEDETAAEED
jgi:non-structural maintenance of chromosomes element 1